MVKVNRRQDNHVIIWTLSIRICLRHYDVREQCCYLQVVSYFPHGNCAQGVKECINLVYFPQPFLFTSANTADVFCGCNFPLWWQDKMNAKYCGIVPHICLSAYRLRMYSANQWRTQDFWGGFNKFSWGQRERGSGGGSSLVRGSEGSCNLVQEISFHMVKFS